jgi:uracil-DNA glycosylase family protein
VVVVAAIPRASERRHDGYWTSVEATDSAAAFLPERLSLATLREAARGCTACPLWRTGTQTVFGDGLKRASLMLVGEQPGDREDLEGRPFVGPAGRLLAEALAEAGIDRSDTYLTNAVKHFKWEPRGKRRIHQKPNSREIAACRPWVEAELAVVAPRVLVCLGATAAQALLGRDVRVTRDRGRPLESELAPVAFATVHPSSILRAPDREARVREEALFVEDLRVAAAALRDA